MIYFIDEDIGQAEAWCFSLRTAGFETEQIRDANSAYRTLSSVDNVELVFIDVMLAVNDSVGSDGGDYNRKRTEDNMITGLCLLDDLSAKLGPQFLKKCILLSCTGKDRVLSRIRAKSNELKVPFWPKFDFQEPRDFTDKVKEILNK